MGFGPYAIHIRVTDRNRHKKEEEIRNTEIHLDGTKEASGAAITIQAAFRQPVETDV